MRKEQYEMKKKVYLLILMFILPRLAISTDEIIIRWPFDSQPQFDKKVVIRRAGGYWYKDGWAISQDGTFLARRPGYDHRGI